ncbi:NAD-dependent epimerase/dehydratase family protein [Alkalihalobacillus trypoxylicola]|uniref:UDP-glucose 4-epimerase n=1 Tax=Alkalihalobacillus trypoxylicola TaxID=519424 RepID=A0A162EED3_9BACI|nr:NAD(P)-dependent oxidoreductase [Alkalihalobacillus trypoxylicola]KYG32375.1 UDP-glucose 4-epimerase [Alkalihalobacillus trypoxylicola]GAF64000.1 UDP-glucose 4-epimerase [Bacillus sp. TS-2]
MQKVVVTGAMGFIGYHLCQRLVQSGYEVVGIDEVPKDREREIEEMRMRLGRNALFHLIKEKIENVDLQEVLADADVVFHLAASTKFDSKWPRLQEVIANNVFLTKQLLMNCSEKTRFIYPSTVQVYGERPGLITEKTPTNPTSAYGITKLASETIIKKIGKEKGIDFLIYRLPTVYGPFQREDMTYQQLLNQVDQPSIDRSLIDVLFIDDLIEALMLAIQTPHVKEIFHIATGKRDEWYAGIQLLTDEPDKLRERSIVSTLSIEKAKTLLQFEAKTTIEEGLEIQKQHHQKWQAQKGQS